MSLCILSSLPKAFPKRDNGALPTRHQYLSALTEVEGSAWA